MKNTELIKTILEKKKKFGKELLILTHHYQRKEIVDLGDFRGDSFGLSQRAAADKDAKYIVFCGVHFMAESAEILSQPYQIVQIPEIEAGCWMADMADIILVEKAWDELLSITGSDTITPIVYMNSDADLKAFCGRQEGIVCTSSNATKAFEWGFAQREKIFFFPDQHLGRNSANQLGIDPEQMIVWNPEERFGGNDPDAVKKAKVILWDGYCLVHTRFKVEHIDEMRQKFPGAKIIVHPECTEDVVAHADAVGSTSYIVQYVDEAVPGSVIIVGTEINLIKRLAMEYPEKQVIELHHSLCPNMSKINLKNLDWTLENIGKVNVVEVPSNIKIDARRSLDRMLAL